MCKYCKLCMLRRSVRQGGGGGGGGGGVPFLSFECGLFNRRPNRICFVLIYCFYSVRGCTTSAYAEIISIPMGTEQNYIGLGLQLII